MQLSRKMLHPFARLAAVAVAVSGFLPVKQAQAATDNYRPRCADYSAAVGEVVNSRRIEAMVARNHISSRKIGWFETIDDAFRTLESNAAAKGLPTAELPDSTPHKIERARTVYRVCQKAPGMMFSDAVTKAWVAVREAQNLPVRPELHAAR
ncbi:hypothetical protein [Granulibacter bethesdensis]|uniref:hypothetical protein n=1 Tax=Granulibacter bethesdensis TaxID=364410 RepID=UPI0003F1EA31|nr:hypothetical protein [Granulibacter bethesdensis]AHJ68515.1 putative secreted protein [Granulibacter bethesdensis]APH59998.1 putative secreted protein [Granulibacter bethesdensis]